MQSALKLCLLAGVLLLTAATDPPSPAEPPETERTLTITGQSLTITPAVDVIYLHFSGNVKAMSDEISLSADVVEMDVDAGQVWQSEELNLPSMLEDYEHITREPGQTISQMANELEMPEAHFSQSSLKRVGAAGNVRVEDDTGLVLTTSELISTDGGQSWAATSRSQLWRDDPDGNHAEMSADFLLLDIQEQKSRALARGNIVAEITVTTKSNESLVSFEAQRCEMDLEKQTLSVSEGLEANFEDFRLCCGALSANLDSQLLRATDTPHLQDTANGTTLDADSIDIDIENRSAVAVGNVWINDPLRGISLSAGRIEADMEHQVFIATAEPELRYGGSTYTGESITVTVNDEQEDEQVVLEISGPQHAHINLDEITADATAEDG